MPLIIRGKLFRKPEAIDSAKSYRRLEVDVVFSFLLFGAYFLVAIFCPPAFSQPSRDERPVTQNYRRPSYVKVQIRTSIQTLAAAAKGAFRERMEPPIPKLSFYAITIGERDLFSVLRDYAQKSFDAAIDALAAEATNPERALAVEKALRIFVEADQASAADAIFTEMVRRKTADARDSAAALRHSVALVELPAALAKLIKPPYEPLPFRPLGEKALPAYKRAAELDPGDAWTWIILALMEMEDDNTLFESAIRNAERSAAAIDDWRTIVFSKQLLGLTLGKHGQFSEAGRACSEAVSLARQRIALNPSDAASQRELARSLVWFGAIKVTPGNAAEARAAYEEALSIRKELVASHPDSMQAKVDLIASYDHLWLLLANQGLKDKGKKYSEEAWRIYKEIAGRSRFVPTINALQSGVVADVSVKAGGLTLILGLVFLIAYRRRITRLMHATAKNSTVRKAESAAPPISLSNGLGDISIRHLDATDRSSRVAYRSEFISRADTSLRRAAWVYAIAGGVFATMATFLWFALIGLEFRFVRAAAVFLAWAWPVVFTLNLLWGQDRRRLGLLLLVYFGALLCLCLRVAVSDTPPLQVFGLTIAPFFQLLVFWGLAVFPTLFLLMFLTRSIRAIGPVLLVFMICVLCGDVGAIVALSMHGVMKALIDFNSALGVSPIMVTFWLARLAGMAVFVPLGWIVISKIRRRYEAKRFSDQVIVFDSIWLFQTLLLCHELILEAGYRGWVGLGAFGLYKFIAWVSLLPLAAAASQRQPARLLLLRVFGFRRRTERFFDMLGVRWHYAGPIQLIAAPDLASRSIDPAKFLEFLGGRLHRRFLIKLSDLDQRLAEFDDRPDPDGRYRVNELFCGDDAWREAVRRLMAKNDLVVMDLRGFSPKNQGCIFELQSLIDLVAVGRTVVLVDESTNVPFLRETISKCWHTMAGASPNRKVAGALTVLKIGRRDALAIQALLEIADEMLESGPIKIDRDRG